MKQLLILSGKGGTGKTTVAAALIKLSKVVAYADCDVDAPNLHLITAHKNEPEKKDFFGLAKAFIDIDKCIKCGLCKEKCKFDAIHYDKNFYVENYSCEGCGVCEMICPTNAISMKDEVTGDLLLYRNDVIFSSAKLRMGSGASGKLVTEVKNQLSNVIKKNEFAIIDGSPGIGCPVIASLSGADFVLIVTEPSISGINDLERIIKTAKHFGNEIAICVNKYDTNLEKTNEIENYCTQNNLCFIGKIPYDGNVVKAINNGLSIVDFDCPSGNAMKNVYAKISEILKTKSVIIN